MLTPFAIYRFVKDKLGQTEKDSPEYNALFEVYNFIRVNMNSTYGMTGNLDKHLVEDAKGELFGGDKNGNEN